MNNQLVPQTDQPPTLKEMMKGLRGYAKRKFLLLRMIDMDVFTAIKLCGVSKGLYNLWLTSDPLFHELNSRKEELFHEHKQEVLTMLRRENQTRAVVLEAKLLETMEEELRTGEYKILKTAIGKEVYTKLVSDLDWQPTTLALTWEQQIANIWNPPQEVTDGEYKEINIQEEQHPQSNNGEGDKQGDNKVTEEVKAQDQI